MATLLMTVLAGVFVLLSPILVLVGQGHAQKGKPALVLASPFGPDAQDIAESSGLTPLAPLQGRMAVFVQIDSVNSIALLRENGAWLVRDGRNILALCGVSLYGA
ncbi:MAG: hypothetical protein AAF922_19540 [Pseudomonadota bacterium]